MKSIDRGRPVGGGELGLEHQRVAAVATLDRRRRGLGGRSATGRCVRVPSRAAKHAGESKPGSAQPVDRAVPPDQRDGLGVADQGVVLDGQTAMVLSMAASVAPVGSSGLPWRAVTPPARSPCRSPTCRPTRPAPTAWSCSASPGDLAKKKLFPAVYRLHAAGPARHAGRRRGPRRLDRRRPAQPRQGGSLEDTGEKWDQDRVRPPGRQHGRYVSGDYADPTTFEKLKAAGRRRRAPDLPPGHPAVDVRDRGRRPRRRRAQQGRPARSSRSRSAATSTRPSS